MVSALSATWSETTSARSKISSKEACLPPMGAAEKAAFSRRDQPRSSLGPKARKSSAVRRPMSPRPTTPMTLLRSSRPPAEWAQPPPRSVRSEAGISRKTARARPNESSATASVEYAGTFTTEMPRCLHASRSTWLKPVNETATTLQFGWRSSTCAVTGDVTVTTAQASDGASRAQVTPKPWPSSAFMASVFGICWSCSTATVLLADAAAARRPGAMSAVRKAAGAVRAARRCMAGAQAASMAARLLLRAPLKLVRRMAVP
mmetsp:Transcript_81941/g.231980  ORF Transcript_81941/g.231980 Transcript_81941/m.231980 type:complete len:261 (+) Transcript_81941:348-1130(+)